MRYFREPKRVKKATHGFKYSCSSHPLYNQCTLYFDGATGKGLAVIQQRFNRRTKTTMWGPIDVDLIDDIYDQDGFDLYFQDHARRMDPDGLYPTITVRELMWILRMKPLPRMFWESKLYSVG